MARLHNEQNGRHRSQDPDDIGPEQSAADPGRLSIMHDETDRGKPDRKRRA